MRTALDLPRGDVLVHSSLRRIGGPSPAAVLTTLYELLGRDATIVVYAQTDRNSTTSRAYQQATAGMSAARRAAYEDTIEGFRLDLPGHRTGAFAEYVRTLPGAVRSRHPQTSFAAYGPRAAEYLAVHDLDCHLGERSPLGALYRAGAATLLLGVGFESCTALHLAEYRLPGPPADRAYRCFSCLDGERVALDFRAPHLDDSDFGPLGEELADQPFVRSGRFGDGIAHHVPIRPAVDYAVTWLTAHRKL